MIHQTHNYTFVIIKFLKLILTSFRYHTVLVQPPSSEVNQTLKEEDTTTWHTPSERTPTPEARNSATDEREQTKPFLVHFCTKCYEFFESEDLLKNHKTSNCSGEKYDPISEEYGMLKECEILKEETITWDTYGDREYGMLKECEILKEETITWDTYGDRASTPEAGNSDIDDEKKSFLVHFCTKCYQSFDSVELFNTHNTSECTAPTTPRSVLQKTLLNVSVVKKNSLKREIS
ncbi:hypothetical protein QE152_g4267 [Popillia japonica]|uniref:C2H2-type domain-containing protein n=1 Tax=Popillia japonica TaxID=7064 RepID=A0AAW1N2Z4_POPJA